MLLLAGLCSAVASCAAPVVIATTGFGALQTGTEAFIRGELEAALATPLPEVYEAAQTAIKELEFTPRAAKLGDYNGYVYARETQGRKVDIDLEKKSPRVTKVNIRVGIFGDQAIARLILGSIQKQLSPAPSHADISEP